MKRRVVFICLLCFLLMLGRFIFGNLETVAFNDLMIVDKFILVAGILGAFAFWFFMLADFFTNTEIKHKVIWGFCLVFFSWAASLVYFVIHYFPKGKER